MSQIMVRRRNWLCALALFAGCSLGMQTVPRNWSVERVPECSDSAAAPALDITAGVGVLVMTLMAAAVEASLSCGFASGSVTTWSPRTTRRKIRPGQAILYRDMSEICRRRLGRTMSEKEYEGQSPRPRSCNVPGMGALDPIAGISLEQYADLCAKMKDCGGDLDVCARIAQDNGVDAGSWQQAMDGWNERMANPATAGEVALAYMPLYQAALAKTGDIASASFEDYAGMSVMLNHSRFGLDAMYAHYGIDVNQWSQISMYWVDQLTKDQQLAQRFGSLTGQLRQQLDSGGPPPVAGQGQKASVSAAQVVNAASDITSLPPVAVGENCYVQWSDGNKYPGQVKEAGDGQCLIAFPNGHSEWVPNNFISNSL